MKIRYIFSLLFAMLLFVPMIYAQEPTLAFPTAEGYGKYTKGGRGGKVIEVTTLNCSGSGSFVEALEASGPRTVVFKVGGIIDCSNHARLRVENPYLTIAGQTAPGDGILLKGMPVTLAGGHAIVRYMRFRLGVELGPGVSPSSANALSTGLNDSIIDHVSVSWAPDDTTSSSSADNVTWQRNIISEGLSCAVPDRTYCHSKGMLIGYKKAIKVSIHHNLFANNGDRNPTVGAGTTDLINNVFHKASGAPLFNPFHAPAKMNFIGNYFTDTGQKYTRQLNWFIGQGVAKYATQSLVYAKGNIHHTLRPNNSRPETDILYFSKPPYTPMTTSRISPISYPSETDAFKAYNDVLADVGDNKRLNADGTFSPRLGPVDTRIINQVKTGGGGLVLENPNEVGGYPSLKNATPYADTDHDGMSDLWEDKYGFNKADPTDGSQDSDGDGYTNLEVFLNGTNPPIKNSSPIDTKAPVAPKDVIVF